MRRRAKPIEHADRTEATGASDSEAEEFARAMADVTRLPRDRRGHVPIAPRAPVSHVTVPASSTDHDDDRGECDFVAAGVDRRELRNLRRGAHVPGSRLDLHSLSSGAAVAAVKRFIDNSRSRYRCVCIIHGRGLHSERAISILKPPVRACLRQHPAVLAYANAPRADGGSGAVYVLLRK